MPNLESSRLQSGATPMPSTIVTRGHSEVRTPTSSRWRSRSAGSW
jgi:hypothetical protein